MTEKFDGEKLVKKLLKFRSSEDVGLRQAMLAIHDKIDALDAEIDAAESELNKLTYELYNLSDEEIKLVEAGMNT